MVIACALTSNRCASLLIDSSTSGFSPSWSRHALRKASGISRAAANWFASISWGSLALLDLEFRKDTKGVLIDLECRFM